MRASPLRARTRTRNRRTVWRTCRTPGWNKTDEYEYEFVLVYEYEFVYVFV